MKAWIAFWNILVKDMRAYYLKPPNVSWGLIFPLAWAGMFFIRSGSGLDSVAALLPGVVAVSVLFGTASLLAVTVTFEKRGRSFERLLLFLCGLFFPIEQLPIWLRPLSYVLPLTYGADVLHASIHQNGHLPLGLDFGLLAAFCVMLFAISFWNIKRRWIV